ncbi:MAG: HNH endonuclease [Opitutales bacterium]|nr:HNH endonuclease [Opitutales bacterium]
MTAIRRAWTREELLLALRLYHRTPFGQQHRTHPPIVALAERLGRTPGSIAMKLNNFTSLDPAERARGVVGLSGASQLDRAVWGEFEERPLDLVDEMEATAEAREIEPPADEIPAGPSEATGIVRVRRHQRFFRRVVLSSYGQRCCLTGNPFPALLRASHILPWAASESERVNPRNGLCLNALHDAAFDRGLITFDEATRLVLSPALRDATTLDTLRENFQLLEGSPLRAPEKNLPDPALLEWHREKVFVG